MITVAIANHKGGVGKTTTTINLGASFARLGKRCLLIDLDPQANLTQSLNATSKVTIYNTLLGEAPLTPVQIKSNLEVIPSTLDLSGAELELASEAGRELILKELLKPFKRKYEYVFIDCPPSLGILTLNAIVACDRVIIPLQTHYLAIQGLKKLIDIIAKIKTRLNKKIKIGGIVFTQYDQRRVLDREVVNTVSKAYKGKIFKSKIRSNIALAESPSKGVDIISYAPSSHGTKDYIALAREVGINCNQ